MEQREMTAAEQLLIEMLMFFVTEVPSWARR